MHWPVAAKFFADGLKIAPHRGVAPVKGCSCVLFADMTRKTMRKGLQMFWNFRRSNRRAAVLVMALGTTAVAAVMPGPAMAQESGTRTFDIPAGALPDAVLLFGQQASLQVSGDSALTHGRATHGVKGALAPGEALARLLEGTGLTFRFSSPTAVQLEPAPQSASAIALGAVQVEGQGANGAGAAGAYSSDPFAGMINPPTTVGSKSPVNQREIPQTVFVVTQQQIQDQSLRTVDDAMRYAPGVTTEVNQPGFSSYYTRGFPINTTQLDGVPTGIPTSGISGPTDGLAMYDRVEVLSGPAGLLNGFGGDGGVLNLVRKRAPGQFAASVQASVGSYENGDIQADIGGPLAQDGTIRARLVGEEQYQDLMQDGTWQRNQQIYGTLEADLTPATSLRLGASFNDIASKPMYGLPNYTDYTLPDISRSAYLGPDWNHFSNKRFGAFAQVEQKLGGDWTAKLSYNYLQTTTGVLTGAMITADPVTGLSNRYSVNTHDENTQHAVDLYADGSFQLFGRTHHLTVGANYLHTGDTTNQFLINPDTGLDFEGDITAPFFDNSAYSRAFAGGPQNDIVNISEQYGVYGNVRFSLLDPLTLVVSGRVTWWSNDSIPDSNPNNNFFGNVRIKDGLPAKFSPMVGLVYDIDNHQTAYASYSTIYLPQSGDETFTGKIIDPINGEQFEFGEKGEYFDGRLSTNLALFRITETNRAMSDPAHIGFDIAQGTARSQGVELRVSGEVVQGWTVGGGYTFTDYHNYDSSFTSHQSFSVVTPKNLFKLWTEYQLPGDFSQWRVGGAIYASSKVSYTDSNGFLSNFTLPGGTFSAAGYATVDAHIGYKLNDHWDALLSVTNIGDTKYISSLTTGGLGTYYGDPRKVLFTVRATL